jgi:ribosomal protein L12E/L44/L45/RPP1/RPP2
MGLLPCIPDSWRGAATRAGPAQVKAFLADPSAFAVEAAPEAAAGGGGGGGDAAEETKAEAKEEEKEEEEEDEDMGFSLFD